MLAAAKFRCWGSLVGLILRILGKGFGEVQVRGFTTGITGGSQGARGKSGVGLISYWLRRGKPGLWSTIIWPTFV